MATDLATFTHLRPSEIKTYHKTAYDRISPAKVLDGNGKTILITGGGAECDLPSISHLTNIL